MTTSILGNALKIVKVFLLSTNERRMFLLFEKISELCEKNGTTIARLEKDAGLGNATVRGWKKSSPSAENLKKVADLLGCTVDELLTDN